MGMSIFEILGHRLIIGLGTLLFVSVLVFLGTEILPGDVAHAILGQGATPELVEQVRDRLGLNEPLHVRYFVWLTNFVSGDFGTSLANGADIGTEIGRRASNTILLALSTALISVPLAVALGLLAAVKPGGLIDRTITSTSLALISFPDFLVAVVLVTIFAIKLRWLPAIASIRPSYEFLDWVRILILPVTALSFTILAHMVRMTRSAVLNVLASPAIEMAILKGVPRKRLLLRHALPNALGPIINVVALNLAYLISGVVVIETLFNFPGLGRYMVEAVTNRDVPIVQTCAMIFCSFYVVLNMSADILSILANPRVRYKK
jgi:peptide/nickel transport system permease protein